MPKYLVQDSYTADGTKGLLKDGGVKRRAAATALVESLGGKVDCFYFAFGETDVVAVVDLGSGTQAGVGVYSPEGKKLASIGMSVPTNVCFGRGPESSTLYITASSC